MGKSQNSLKREYNFSRGVSFDAELSKLGRTHIEHQKILEEINREFEILAVRTQKDQANLMETIERKCRE